MHLFFKDSLMNRKFKEHMFSNIINVFTVIFD